MSFRARALLVQLVVALAVLALAVTAYVSLKSTNDARERTRFAYAQLHAMMELAVFSNRYSEQIAEVLLIGEAERPDFESARKLVGESLAKLRGHTEREIESISDPREREEERRELFRIDQMQRLVDEVDRQAERVFILNGTQQRDAAIALFRTEIENRLDAELDELITQGIEGERGEVARVEAHANQLSRRLVTSMVIISLLLLLLSVGSGLAFTRAFSRPIQALSAGALAVERGDLDHRIAYSGNNELGALARRFNDMVSELSHQRRQLISAQADLERQVTERTEELAAMNQKLTLADQQRVRFLADASHELRTPLTALRGEAEVTLRGPSKQENVYREALAAIVNHATALGRLVDDLLFLARSESGELRFNFKRLPLSPLLAEAISEVEGLARAHEILIALQPVDAEWTVVVDERRFRQALVIVLDNAIKYSDRLTTVRMAVDAADADIIISVRDQGAGIDPADIPYLFERFHRTEASRSGPVQGSGLGLSIARWIIENHAGTIDLSSVPGKGTEVHIRLPSVR